MYSEGKTATKEYIELQKRIFAKSTLDSMDQNQRFVAAMHAISQGDQRPFLYFSEEDRLQFLLKSDEKFAETAKDLNIPIQERGTYEELATSIKEEINDIISQMNRNLDE